MNLLTSRLPPLHGAGFWVAFWQVAAVYYGFAALIHWVVPAFFDVETVQVGKRRPGQVRKEALLSVGPIAVKALVFTVVEHLSVRRPGITRLYSGPIEGISGWCYVLFTIAALDALHDAWFYFTHRLMHSWRFLYKNVHSLHHESTVPTAFTGYAFHPVEGVIVFLNEILVTFLFPIHVGLHRAYHLWTTVIHNGGHAGYEIAPFIPSVAAVGAGLAEAVESLFAGKGVGGRRWRWWKKEEEGVEGGKEDDGSDDDGDDVKRHHHLQRRRRQQQQQQKSAATSAAAAARAALNTVRHHDMHHRFPFAHFSLYFTHWDRLLGTEHAGYRAAVEAHFLSSREKQKKSNDVVGDDGGDDDSAREEKRGGELPSSSLSLSSSYRSDGGGSREGLERLASAMEEYGASKDKKKSTGSGGSDGSSSGSDVASKKHQRHRQRSRLRPRSPAIGAYWHPASVAAAGDGDGNSDGGAAPRRRSSRLAQAA